MTANFKMSKLQLKEREKKYVFNGKCFICDKIGHKAKCRSKDKKSSKRTCSGHNSNKTAAIIMDTEQGFSRGKDRSKPAKEEEEQFVLRVSEWNPHSTQQQDLLVDSGASAHIMTDEGVFIRFDETFQPKNHIMQLADGTRTTGIVQKKGDAQIELTDCTGRVVSIKLTDALLIPDYPQNILSVDAATSRGATFNFEKNNNKMVLPDGTTCRMKVKDRLYYLNIVTEKDVSNNDSCNVSFDLKTWHEIMGHCNYGDIVKLETVVNGMKIKDKMGEPNQCTTCLQGKFSQSRNRQSDGISFQKAF